MKIVTEKQIFSMLSTGKICVFVHPQHNKTKTAKKYAEELGIPFEEYKDAEYLIYDFDDVVEAMAWAMEFDENTKNFHATVFVDGEIVEEVSVEAKFSLVI